MSLATLALGLAGAAHAGTDPAPQQPAPAADTAPTQPEIIVTGSAGGRGINRMAAAYAITNVSAADLTRAAPKSSAEMLTLVPGVWVESSGGVAGANITVRGLPSASDAPFVTFQLQGLPVFPAPSLSFQDNSSLFRLDETISRVEAVRGGPGAVFSNGQPGLTVNNVLREGGEDTEGLIKGSFTDYGTKRIDARLSGKLADGLYYMVGGYATTSPGIRSTQFDSEVGKQISINITKTFDGGKFSLYTRLTDDHGTWYLPFATNVPGLNLGTYSQLGNYSRYATIPTGAGSSETFDLAHGRGWKGSISGAGFEKSFGAGWSVRAHAAYTQGRADTYGLVPDGNAVKAGAVQAITGSALQTLHNSRLGANDYVQNWGAWIVQKDIKALTGDFSIAREFAGHEVTLGYYGTNYSSNDFWSLGNFRPMQVTQNGDYLTTATTCANLAAAGSGSGCWQYAIRDAGTTHVNAGYLADTWHITDTLKLDLAGRVEHNHTTFTLYSNSGGALYPVMTAPAQVVDDARTHFSWTGGLDYRVMQNLGVFGRISRGWFNPVFDDFRNAYPKAPASAKLTSFELGAKWQGRMGNLYLTGFHNRFRGANTGDVLSANLASDDVNATGLEVDGRLRVIEGFSIGGNATFQTSEIVASTTPANVGKQFQRMPNVQLHISPTYDFAVRGARVSLFGTYGLVGRRYVDDTNVSTLPAYAKVDLGATVKLAGVELGVNADNLFNSHGLTEGDPRNAASVNARPIFGRSFKFSVGYRF